MDIIANIKARREAAWQCIKSDLVSQQDKQILEKSQNFLSFSYYASKALIVTGFLVFVDWKKPVSFLKRQLPLACLAFGFCAAADYACSQYAFKMNGNILQKYTGYQDGIFVSPSRYAVMKNKSRDPRIEILKQEQLMSDE